MSDPERHETEPKNAHPKDELPIIIDSDSSRPRPMTTSEHIGLNPRGHVAKPTRHKGLGSFDKVSFDSSLRASSANPQKDFGSPSTTRKQSGMAIRLAKYSELSSREKSHNYTIQTARVLQSPSADVIRLRPKNIPQDKERLYGETLQLKQTMNGLREENLRLKTKVNNLEKEAAKFERMIQESANAYQGPKDFLNKTENHLTLALKHNLKELKNVLKKKEDELTEVKKMMKYTRIQEMEAQTKAYQEETSRLRTVIDHVMSEKAQLFVDGGDKNRLQEEFFIQATQLKTLKRDNEEMATAIKILEEQNFEYEKKNSEQEKRLKREQANHKKVLQEREKEIIKLRNEIGNEDTSPRAGANRKANAVSGKGDEALRVELEKKINEVNNLVNQLAEKRNQMLGLERQLRDVKNESNEKISSLINEKQALLRELEKQRSSKTDIQPESTKTKKSILLNPQELKPDDYIKRASLQTFTPEEKLKLAEYSEADTLTKSQELQKKKTIARKRVQKVRPEDVKDIGYELNLRLRIKKLTFEEIDRVIWPEKVRKSAIITVKEMIEILRNDPFHLTNEDEILLTARYLVEDNESEYLLYDENAKNDLHIVRSILKKMIGNLPPFDETKTQQMHDDISEIVISNANGLRENLKALCRNAFLNERILREACNLIDVTLTNEQVEYIVLKLFERSDNVQKLSIDHLFEIFSTKPQPKVALERPRTSENVPTIRINTDPHPVKNEEQKTPSDDRHKENNYIGEAHYEEDDEDNEGSSPVKNRQGAEADRTGVTVSNEQEEQYKGEEEEEEEQQADGSDDYEGEEHEKYQSEEHQSKEIQGEEEEDRV